jgi:hypothetical protein
MSDNPFCAHADNTRHGPPTTTGHATQAPSDSFDGEGETWTPGTDRYGWIAQRHLHRRVAVVSEPAVYTAALRREEWRTGQPAGMPYRPARIQALRLACGRCAVINQRLRGDAGKRYG